jgi:hypothetical protein
MFIGAFAIIVEFAAEGVQRCPEAAIENLKTRLMPGEDLDDY